MNSVNVTIRVDEDLKNQADSLNLPNAVTEAAMRAAENEEDIYGPFDDIEALKEALNAKN